MNLPNLLTVIRILLIPFFIFIFFSTLDNNLIYSTLIFIIAGLTDVLDGFIARKYNLITKLGQVMDPLADKLMQLTVLICLTIEGYISIWIIIFYGIKELTMILGGIILYSRKDKVVIPANFYGKFATFLFYVAVLSLSFPFAYSRALFVVAITCSLVAFLQYLYIGINKMKKINKNSEMIEKAS